MLVKWRILQSRQWGWDSIPPKVSSVFPIGSQIVFDTIFLLTIRFFVLPFNFLCYWSETFQVDKSTYSCTTFPVESGADTNLDSDGDDDSSSCWQRRRNTPGARCRGKEPLQGARSHWKTPVAHSSSCRQPVRSYYQKGNTPGGHCCGSAPFQGDHTHPPFATAAVKNVKLNVDYPKKQNIGRKKQMNRTYWYQQQEKNQTNILLSK